jgi:hypothetical protein
MIKQEAKLLSALLFNPSAGWLMRRESFSLIGRFERKKEQHLNWSTVFEFNSWG